MVAAANPFDQFDSGSPAASAAPAPAAPAASQSSNPFDQFGPAPGAASPAPAAAPVTYNAALFQQRVGRAPENAQELANFAAQKGAGFAGDPGATTAPGENAVNDAGTGVGIAVADTGRGVYQLGASIAHAAGLISDQKLAQIQAAGDAAKKEEAPTLATTAGRIGNIAGQGLMLATAPEGVAGTIGGSAALAAAQPTDTPLNDISATLKARGINTAAGAAGGALGAGVGFLAGKIVQPFRSLLAPEDQTAVNTLRNSGVSLDLAQQTGSRVAQTLKNVAADNPFLGHSTMPAQSQADFNTAVLKTIGADSDTADQATMGAARDRIGAVLDDVAVRNPVAFDAPLQSDLGAIQTAAGRELSDSQMAPLNKQLDNVLDKAAAGNGQIDGAAYQNIRSSLGRMTANKADPATAHWAGQIQTAVDNAMQRSAAPEDLTQLVQARAQYRAMKQIEGAITDSDDISPASLYNRIDTAKNAAQSIYGRGDQTLLQLAQAGKRVLSNTKTPNSGSAQRIAGMAALGLAGAGGEELLSGDPKKALEGAAFGVGLPLLGRTLVENPAVSRAAIDWSNNAAVRAGLIKGGQTLGTQLGLGAAAPSEPAQ